MTNLTAEKYLIEFMRPVPELEAVRRTAKAKGLDRFSLREMNADIEPIDENAEKSQQFSSSVDPAKKSVG